LGSVREWRNGRGASLILLPLLFPVALAYSWDHEHFLTGLGWLAWPLAWLIQIFVLRIMDKHADRGAATWHFASFMLLSCGLALESAWWLNLIASDAWAGALAASVAGILAMLVWQFRQRPPWPVPAHPVAYLAGSLVLVTVQVLLLAGLAINMPGDPAPWPYIPVFNPFDLAMLFAMLTSARAMAVWSMKPVVDSPGFTSLGRAYQWMLAGAFFVLTTMALVRGVHHFSAVAWNADALFNSTTVQTALSIYWGLLGFTGMIWGTRNSHRPVWLTGAGFMALVVLKLFVIDLGNTGTVARIISFIGIGALLLVVGYFAPAPPKTDNP
jgi:uncharacterized membrane protein